MERNVYRCSNGQFYGDVGLWQRLESGEWSPCCWDQESGMEWVSAGDGELLSLTPVPESDLPPGLTATSTEAGVRVEPTSTKATPPGGHR